MVITYQKDAGLLRGLEIGGGALAQAIQQAAQIRAQQELPAIKERARAQGIQQFLFNNFGIGDGGAQPNQDQIALQAPAQGAGGMTTSATPQSAIAEARLVQNKGSNVSGVPVIVNAIDSNARAPQEQTVYQQGGAASTALNPPSENGNNPALAGQQKPGQQNTENAAPKKKTIADLSDEQLVQLAGSPYEETRNLADAEFKRRDLSNKTRTAKENTLLKLNEPKLYDLNEKIQLIQETGDNLARMNDIITNHGDKLPSAWKAAFFDFDSDTFLSRTGRSQLSPEAQDFVKLIAQSVKGAKGTYGARLTDLDVTTYLKGQPGLLNTPEGRKRIVDQLRIANKINEVHYGSILNEFEKAGGSDQISYSKAEASAKKSVAKEVAHLRDLYTNPNRKNFAKLPDASMYKGKEIRDDDTGELLFSDGKEWVKR